MKKHQLKSKYIVDFVYYGTCKSRKCILEHHTRSITIESENKKSRSPLKEQLLSFVGLDAPIVVKHISKHRFIFKKRMGRTSTYSMHAYKVSWKNIICHLCKKKNFAAAK
jgi:hypothetical protein